MNCEQVEERLSAYLDNMLVPAEWRDVTVHLQTCPCCLALLTELRQNDVLLSQLPRVAPPPSLRERFFALSEVHELCEDSPDYATLRFSPPPTRSTCSSFDPYDERISYSLLSSLVGGRESQTPPL